MAGIFISHTHGDKALADAIAGLIQELFGEAVSVNYSSKKELAGGIGPGVDWAEWIAREVVNADVAFVLLTPSSIQKPWLLWEAGAVEGTDRATRHDKDQQRVWPLIYGLGPADIPSPFGGKQVIDGTSAADMEVVVDALFQRLGLAFTPVQIKTFGARQKDAVHRYVETVAELLLKLPLRVTEDAVQEWLLRLDQLDDETRFSEVAVLENWIDVAFGRDEQDRVRPIDVRLHRRMGDLYARANKPADAARQFELARKLVPRDIFVLRRLGKAHLDGKNTEAAGSVLETISALDATAFERNVENAALKARWCESVGDLRSAREVLDKAYRVQPSSYYLGDRLGQILLREGDFEQAKTVYRQVLRTIEELAEDNVWTNATSVTAAIVLGRPELVESFVNKLKTAQPSKDDRETIRRGLCRVLELVHGDTSILDRLWPSAMPDGH